MERSITMRVSIPDTLLAGTPGMSPAERFAYTVQRTLVQHTEATVKGFTVDRRGTRVVTERGDELEHEIDRLLGKYLTAGPPIKVRDEVAIVYDKMDRGDLVSDVAELVRRLMST